MNWKRKYVNSRKIIVKSILLTIIVFPIFVFIMLSRIPEKYAVKIADIDNYQGCILVKEAFHTGTGWEQVGDERGYFQDKNREDIYLTGNLPGETDTREGDNNTYLCIAENVGYYVLNGDDPNLIFKHYNVVEWYPIYPVNRNTILPPWIYPANYLSKGDFYGSIF